MGAKGNRIENWEEQYKILGVTYTEEVKGLIGLEQVYSYEFVRKHIEENLSGVKDPKVLEVGCGGARNALYLALRGFDVTCSDFSPEGIRLAKANFGAFGAKGEFLLDDLMRSKIPESSFDCVMSFGLLEHFEDLRPVIANLTRMVRPGGIQIHLIIPRKFSTEMMRDWALYPVRFLKNMVRGDFRQVFTRSYRDFPHYENSFSRVQYCGSFRECGNDIIRCEPSGLLKPLIMIPLGVGDWIARSFGRQILAANDAVRRCSHPLCYFMSPTLIIVARKR